MIVVEKEDKIKEGDIIPLIIKSIGRKKDGVAFVNKMAVIVPFTEVGKKYMVKIVDVKNSMAFGLKIREMK